MGPPHLNRIPVALPHKQRLIVEAMAKAEGKPWATVAKDLIVMAIELSLDGDGTWFRSCHPVGTYPDGVQPGDKDWWPDGAPSYGPNMRVSRFSPVHLQMGAQERPKRSGAKSGGSGRKPAQSRAGAARRKKGAK